MNQMCEFIGDFGALDGYSNEEIGHLSCDDIDLFFDTSDNEDFDNVDSF